MEQNSKTTFWFPFIILILLSVFPLGFAVHNHTALNDDTYITLTYAKNLAAGRGFVYNHPPPTLGTTTPFLALSVAGVSILIPGIDIAALAVFLTACCWAGIGWVFLGFRHTWGLRPWDVVIIELVLISTGWIGFLGMEAYLFAFLLVLTLSTFYTERYFFAGLLGGLLFLTRGEGILVLGLMGVLQIARLVRQEHWFLHRDDLGPVGLLGLGGLLPLCLWGIYAWFTFGQIVPNTLAAKQAQGQLATARPFLQRLVQEWLPSWGRALALEGRPYVSGWWLLVGLGIMIVWLKRRKWLIFLAWIVLYIVGYTALQVSAYWWYQLPVHFVAQLLVALGLIAIVNWLRSIEAGLWVRVGLIAVVLISTIGLLTKSKIQAVRHYQGDPRAESYMRLSEWFRDNTSPGASIAYLEVGYLGYYTPNRIIDPAGLVMPEVVSHVVEDGFTWAFWAYRPDYYVYLPDLDWALGGITSNPEFDRAYEPVATLPGPRETDFTIYQRGADAE